MAQLGRGCRFDLTGLGRIGLAPNRGIDCGVQAVVAEVVEEACCELG